MHFLFLHSLFYFLSSPFLVFSQIASSSDNVDPNDPHISDLLVPHYDCSKQHNSRQFSLTRSNHALKPHLLLKVPVLLSMILFALKLNVLKLGPVKLM